jgi:hypothetical protein
MTSPSKKLFDAKTDSDSEDENRKKEEKID